ncbi:S-layer homology domain-containing protein [Cohnella sp. WQ 127256]|uniref:S-layer homology domain-containing protein n=1 Tax=Cohnella sp. WQ 127256 TaxID=2938790 RepID=UPI0021185B84|nr:S-layer homology domain-containing protein [Cohnella sp. WQ 127256]
MWQKKLTKRFVSIAIMISMIFTGCVSVFAGSLKDTQGHWAESSIQSWVDQGLISGYKDGTFKPNGNITRSELIVLINKSFGFKEEDQVLFTDVKPSNWFYTDLSKAVAAEYLTDVADGTFRPVQAVTRQEAASILTKLLALTPSQSADGVVDVKDLSESARGAIGAVVDVKLMGQNTKGQFRPNDKITRAEAVVVLTRALQYKKAKNEIVYAEPGVYGPTTGSETVSKNVRITSPGVTLQNMVLEGNMTIEKSVGDGDVFLKHVSVKGTTEVNGGGAKSVHLVDSVIIKLIVNKKDGSVRIVVEGSTEVREVILYSSTRLEESKLLGAGFRSIALAESLPAGSLITLIGKFENVDVIATKISLEILQGQVDKLSVDKQATASSISVSKESKILELILAAAVKVIGVGTIEKANIQASGASIEQMPQTVEVGKDVKAEVGGKPAVNGSFGGFGGGGGGGGGGGPVGPGPIVPTNVDKSKLKSAIDTAQVKYNEAVEGLEIGQYLPSTKADFLVELKKAISIYSNVQTTQQQANEAIPVLNELFEWFGFAALRYSFTEMFDRTIEQYKFMLAETPEGTDGGMAVVGSKLIFKEAISTAKSVRLNTSATPQQVEIALYNLQSTAQTFQASLVPIEYGQLQILYDSVLQRYIVAEEGVGTGQYQVGAKEFLRLSLDHVERILKEKPKLSMDEYNSKSQNLIYGLNIFEEKKNPENKTEITNVSRYYIDDSFGITLNSVSGTVYALPSNEFPSSINDLQLLANDNKAIWAKVTGNSMVLDLSGLKEGQFKLYHVDDSGKLSKPFIKYYDVNYSIYPKNPTHVNVQTSRNPEGKIINTITWTDSISKDVSYSIFRNTTPDFEYVDTLIEIYIPEGKGQYIDNDVDLKPGTTYYYKMWVRTKDHFVSFSNSFSITTPSE